MRLTILLAGLLLLPQVAQADTASWYSVEACQWNKDKACPTASGKSLYELEADGVLFAAMWDVPLGSRWEVTNTANGKRVEVVIWDRGPARRLGRRIDLCKAAYAMLADTKTGVIDVEVRRLN